MPESGGPTTQSGTYFQNTVAAWYLARMLHDTLQGQSDNRVIRVRSEAPEEVDDVVVTFERGLHYVQVKEALSVSEKAWVGLWRHFWKQFDRIDPQRDRLILWGGQHTSLFRDLQEMAKRAQSAPSGARRRQVTEFVDRLNKSQLSLVDTISQIVADYEAETASAPGSTQPTRSDIFEMFRIVDVVVKGNAEDIQAQGSHTFLNGLPNASMVFAVLRDLAADKARSRGAWDCDSLYEALIAQGVTLAGQSKPGQDAKFQTEQEALEQELKMRKNNWYMLRQQAAIYGAALAPVHLRNQIEQEEKEIREIERKLIGLN